MGKLTKEQKAEIARRLEWPLDKVKFTIDGHDVVAKVEPYKARRQVVVVYVDGRWDAQHLAVGGDIQKRFYPLKKVALWKPKEREKLIKDVGKRYATKNLGLDKVNYYALPFWTSVKAMLRHFEANNESVQLVEEVREVRDVAGT